MKVVPVCCLCLAENFRNVSYLKIEFNDNFVVLLKKLDITISFKASEKFYSNSRVPTNLLRNAVTN